MKKAIYAITLALLGGALIIQAVWGAQAGSVAQRYVAQSPAVAAARQ